MLSYHNLCLMHKFLENRISIIRCPLRHHKLLGWCVQALRVSLLSSKSLISRAALPHISHEEFIWVLKTKKKLPKIRI